MIVPPCILKYSVTVSFAKDFAIEGSVVLLIKILKQELAVILGLRWTKIQVLNYGGAAEKNP